MGRDQGPFNLANPWSRIGWWSTAALVGVSFALGFVVLARFQVDGPTLDVWSAICRAIGITADLGPAGEPQPPLRTPTRIAWTSDTLAQVASGNEHSGAMVALNCGACHGEGGVSPSAFIPTLAGMDAAVIYKQLDDFRSGKRLWGVMGAMATALSMQDSADLAAYFAGRADGLPPVAGEGLPRSGRSLRQSDPTIRLIFAGDPGRGVPPCAACHGPGAHKLGAPALQGQHAAYIERQLAAFAQGMRQNDINKQMRTIATQLTTDEMHALAAYYGAQDADVAPRNIAISNPWTRATPKGATVGGAYLTITNKGIEADRLIGGSSSVGKFELHQMSAPNGVTTMRPLRGGLEINPGQTVMLEPGLFHFMLLGLKRSLVEGDHVHATLEFAKAGDIDVDFAVEAIGALTPGAAD